jgi:O-antigen/teichoic acid export membrane protein
MGSFAAVSVGAIAMFFAAPTLSQLILSTRAYALPFRLLAFSMVFEVSREISLALIRAQERAGFFIVSSTLQLLVQIGACLYTVVYLNMGVVGVVLGNLTANAVIWIFLTTSTVRSCGLAFDAKHLRPVLAYASPLMVSAISWAIFQSLDRYFLNAYKGLADAGIFSLALRVATIIPVLLVTPFTNSYGPFRFSVMRQKDAQAIYAKVLSYYAFATSYLVLMIAIFSEDLIKSIAVPGYWAAYRVVPLVILPGAISGITYCLQTGIYIEKKTTQILHIALATGFVNFICVWLLVPRWGMLGAAVSGVIFSIYQALHTYFVSQKLFPIRYEVGRLTKIIATAAVIAWIGVHTHIQPLWESIALKMSLLAVFPAMLWLERAYTSEEKSKMSSLWSLFEARVQSRAAAGG